LTVGARQVVFAIPGDLQARTGGYGYARRMIQALGACGWQVQVLTLSARFPHPDAQALAEADAAFAALPDGCCVLVDGLAFGALDALAARQASRLRLCALVHHPLGLEAGLEPARAQALLASERAALAQVRSIVTTSHTTAHWLRTHFDLDQARLHVALPGLDRPAAVATPAPPGTPLRILAIGALIRRKGLDLLIDALAPLQALPWTLRIVGPERDAATAQALREQVASCRLQERIRFVGEVAQTAPELARADLFALPSRHEGYGMVFAEAMAHGLPVLACRAGAVPEVVPPSAGVLVPVEDVAALTEALRTLLTDQSLRALLGAGARQAALQLPGWEDSARVLVQALEAA
jgi:glycosyltransferase involved in cell wall biosynthesis